MFFGVIYIGRDLVFRIVLRVGIGLIVDCIKLEIDLEDKKIK